MNRPQFIDSTLEQALTCFEVLGYVVLLQSDIVSGRHQTILQNCRYGVLNDRFRQAMQRINPTIPLRQIESILRQVTTPRTITLLQQNQQWHLQLLHGVPVQSEKDHPVVNLKLIDFTNVWNNDWLVIRSFPVLEADYQHCLDLVVFVNGLPLAVLHGLQGGEAAWSLRSAYLQLQTYQANLPRFFALNELLILSNGIQSRLGTLSSSWKQFVPLRSAHAASEDELSLAGESELKLFIHNIFAQQRLLEIIQHFILFQQGRAKLTKKLRTQSFCSCLTDRTLPVAAAPRETTPSCAD